MNEVASSFDGAWASFQTRDALLLYEDTLEGRWAQGRAQYLTFLVRIEDTAACAHLARLIERIAGIPGVEPYPEHYWHITVKGCGFQVIKRTKESDVLRQDVARIANRVRAVLADETAFEAQLGLASGFAEVVFVEVLGGDRLAELNQKLTEEAPEIPRYPFDGALLPHVSIARFTSNEGLDQLKTTLAELRSEAPGPTFPVRRLDFIKAWLTEEMPEFETLASYPLRSPR
ncbi:MAG: 2'-5' RNA ligase family protein [Dehalococcoidia bacterium]